VVESTIYYLCLSLSKLYLPFILSNEEDLGCVGPNMDPLHLIK